MNNFTRKDLECGKALCEGATEGPWEVLDTSMPSQKLVQLGKEYPEERWPLSIQIRKIDAPFIAQSRTLLPNALEKLEEAVGLIDETCKSCYGKGLTDCIRKDGEDRFSERCNLGLFLRTFEQPEPKGKDGE